ncbi:MAG: hypothetical protein AABM64_09560 [Pseudomonadota bacterium]
MANEKDRDPQEVRKVIAKHTPVYALMGHLASDWAMLELMVNQLIWKLADVSPVTGACVTAQIFTINNRLMAVISLMRLRGFDETMVKEVNKFSDAIRGPAEGRNRTIHDPVVVSVKDEAIGRLEVTAQRKPVFEVVPISVEEINKVRLEILKCTNDLIDLRQKILEKLRTLPEIPKSSPLPIDLTVMVDRVGPTIGK